MSLRAQPAVGRQPDRPDRAAVYGALDSRQAGGGEYVTGAGDVDVVKDGGILGPQRIVRGDMVQLLAAGEGRSQRGGVEQIAFNPFDRKAGEILSIRL